MRMAVDVTKFSSLRSDRQNSKTQRIKIGDWSKATAERARRRIGLTCRFFRSCESVDLSNDVFRSSNSRTTFATARINQRFLTNTEGENTSTDDQTAM